MQRLYQTEAILLAPALPDQAYGATSCRYLYDSSHGGMAWAVPLLTWFTTVVLTTSPYSGAPISNVRSPCRGTIVLHPCSFRNALSQLKR